jgi:hypothetical protein
MGARVKDNVGVIVEMKRDMESIGIGHQGKHRHEADGKPLLKREGMGLGRSPGPDRGHWNQCLRLVLPSQYG